MIKNDGSTEDIETIALHGDDVNVFGNRTIKTRKFNDLDRDWTDCDVGVEMPVLFSCITTIDLLYNQATKQHSFSGNAVIRCLAKSKLEDVPNRKLELNTGLIQEKDSKKEHTTEGNFKLTINGSSASFFDINDEEFLTLSKPVPTRSSNIPLFQCSNEFSERIMAINTSTPSVEKMNDLKNLYKKGYPESGLVLAHMYQQQAQQYEQKGDEDAAMQAKGAANTLFQEIIESKNTPYDLRATARGMQSGNLKGNSVKDMNFARKLATKDFLKGGYLGLFTAMAASGLLFAGGAPILSSAIGLAVGGAYLYKKYGNASSLKKAGRIALDDVKDCLINIQGGR